MSKLFHTKPFVFLLLLLAGLLVGCSHQKTQRGHLFRGEWAIECNRTPWIGCPPDSGCPDEDTESTGKKFLSCLAKDNDDKKRKGVRRHCGARRGCTKFDPCCQTLGCGMWVEPDGGIIPAATTTTTLGSSVNACGLIPLCSPQKPCGITPNCGVPVNINLQTHANLQAAGGMSGMATVRGMPQNGVMTNGVLTNGAMANGVMTSGVMAKGTSGIVPGTLVSRGIVPGASAITTGGMVAAIGVATPAGTMTPVGVRMPNGMVNNNAVLRACLMSPSCTSAQPCGLTPTCGGAVTVNMVANNAIALASALQAQGVAGGTMQAGVMQAGGMNGMGMLVNPGTNQPINGLTMNGNPQVGYPPIGYAPTGYAPGYPRFEAGMVGVGMIEEEEEEVEEPILPGTRSVMPVPRFHPVPSKPTFQRNEGMPSTPESQRGARGTPVAMSEQRGVSRVREEDLEAALDRAYLEGVSAAMSEVERKIEAQRQATAKAKLQEKILQQAEYVQQQLDEQERLRMLAIQRAQRERQLRQQQAAQQSEMLATTEMVQEPKRLPASKQTAVSQEVAQQEPARAATAKAGNNASANPATLSESLKNSNATGMLASLFGSKSQPQQNAKNTTKPRSVAELASVLSDAPKKPPVSPTPPEFGLSPEDSEPGPLILQAQFTADSVPMKP